MVLGRASVHPPTFMPGSAPGMLAAMASSCSGGMLSIMRPMFLSISGFCRTISVAARICSALAPGPAPGAGAMPLPAAAAAWSAIALQGTPGQVKGRHCTRSIAAGGAPGMRYAALLPVVQHQARPALPEVTMHAIPRSAAAPCDSCSTTHIS